MLNTLARSGLEPVAVKARAVDLLRAALTGFAACQGSASFFFIRQTHPFVYARPTSVLAACFKEKEKEKLCRQ
jgi:hypothetical protein